MKDDLVEKVARAMYEDYVRRHPTYPPHPAWEDLDNADRTYRENYRFEAAAAIRVVREEAAKEAERVTLPSKELTSDYQAGYNSGRLDVAAALRALGEK